MKPTGLYIHVPFCTGKCDYCAFYSITPTVGQIEQYLAAIDREAELIRRDIFAGRQPTLETVFIGGGTPTFLTSLQIDQLLAVLDRHFCLAPCAEFTIETSPETITEEKLAAFVRGGANRISLGVQSFDDKMLERIGRRHCYDDTMAAIEAIRSVGVDEINFDLIFGLPGQSLRQWHDEINRAIDLDPAHLACYELTIEPNTPLSRNTVKCDEELLVEMYYKTKDWLETAGFEQYELSNYAKPGHQCRHNLRYWANLDYIGLGPAAAGYLGGRRYTNVVDVDRYCRELLSSNRLPPRNVEQMTGRHLAGETAMLALRTMRGICRDEFLARTGFDPFELFERQIERFQTLGLLDVRDDSIRLSHKGLIFANEIMGEFLAEDD